jgi:hypothetical protein
MRGTGALVVAAMLDFLTFALCAPYSETTDGKQFDTLLEKVAERGRTLYRLFQQPSHTIVKVSIFCFSLVAPSILFFEVFLKFQFFTGSWFVNESYHRGGQPGNRS